MEEELMKIKAENESLKTNCQNETLSHDGESQAYQTELDRIKQELQETKLELQKQQEAYKLLKQESLADVDHDLQQMRQELHKLMGVIEIKDQEIENLSKQLKSAQTQVYNQEETVKQMKETIQQIETKAASNLSSASSNDGIMSKQNGDHNDGQRLEEIIHQFPNVTLRSASMVENLSSVDETVKVADAPSNDERLQSLIAKYRNPSDQSSSPEKNRSVGRPHSVGPGSNFGGMSRILGLTTPKPFYLSSAGSKFNRFSGSGISTINPPANVNTASTTTSSVPLSTDASAANLSSQSSTFSSLNASEDVPKPSVKIGVSNRPPLPPPRPASRPSSAHNPEAFFHCQHISLSLSLSLSVSLSLPGRLPSCDPARQSTQGRNDYASAVRVDPLSLQAPTRSLLKYRHPGIDWTSNTAVPSAYHQAVALKPDNAPSKLHDRTTTNDYFHATHKPPSVQRTEHQELVSAVGSHFLSTENDFTASKIRQRGTSFATFSCRRSSRHLGTCTRAGAIYSPQGCDFETTRRSDEELLRELFTHVTWGDRTPSQLLRFMRSRLGKHSMAESILRELWMDKLPTTITQILAPIADNTPLDQLANSADRIATKLDQGVCAVQRPDDTPAKETDLEKAVADLQHQLQDIRMLLSRKSRGPMPATGGWRRRARSTSRDRRVDPELCCRRVGAAEPPGKNIRSRLFYVWDRRNHIKFLVDTGAAISVIPPKEQQDRKATPYKLQAANGSTIETYGAKTLTLNIGMRRDFTWTFTQADVKTPILGADFLAHYDLAVHMNTRTLSDNTTNIAVKGTLSRHNTTGISDYQAAILHDSLTKDELTTPALSASILSLLKRRRALYSSTDIQGSTGPRTPLFHRPTT
ncbi:unnamed protein product [Acanthosepion pharaonis]|uniref:Peptidase A2 domain-containing protein n=1 Tax=Acanthosepion pharaonis TaxID=158019 RepID=A0A812C6H6_ACAPH|nr:unnamed protein product [Sepia pharaonis]